MKIQNPFTYKGDFWKKDAVCKMKLKRFYRLLFYNVKVVSVEKGADATHTETGEKISIDYYTCIEKPLYWSPFYIVFILLQFVFRFIMDGIHGVIVYLPEYVKYSDDKNVPLPESDKFKKWMFYHW